MTSSTLHLSNLSTENDDSSKPALANFHDIFQDREFKDFVGDRLGSSIKTRGSVREKTSLRLLNKDMDNLLQSSLTEVHLGYDGLQKLSQSKFKETVKKIKVTINSSNHEGLRYDVDTLPYISINALKLLSPNIFKNVKLAKVIIDKSIDPCDIMLRLQVDFDEFLYLRGLKILNQSFCERIQFKGKHDTKLEICNSQFERIGLDCCCCKAYIYDINIINTPLWGIAAYKCIQSIFEGISVDGATHSAVELDKCNAIQLKNISVKNCKFGSFWIWGCQNLDIKNISVLNNQSKNGVYVSRSNGCIQDGIIEASTHGITLSRSQISYKNVSISCDDDVFKKDEQSSWNRLE